MPSARCIPILIALVAAPAFAQDKHQLRLRFVPNTTVNYVVTQDMDMAMKMGAQDMGTKTKIDVFMQTKVNKVEGNVGHLEQKVTRVKANMDNAMMGKTEFDSADANSNPGPMKGLSDMVGEKTMMQISDAGKLIKVDSDGELAQKAKMSGVDLNYMMSMSVASFPEHPVAIGEIWETSHKIPMGRMGELEAKMTNKLIAVDDKFITIETKMDVNTDETELPMGMSVESMTAKGKNKVDRRTGLPAMMTMDMNMKMSGRMPVTMTIKQSMKEVAAAEATAKDKVAEPATTGGGK